VTARLAVVLLLEVFVSVEVLDEESLVVEDFVVASELLADRLSVVASVVFVVLVEALMSPEFDVLLFVVVSASVLELPLVVLPAVPVPIVARVLD